MAHWVETCSPRMVFQVFADGRLEFDSITNENARIDAFDLYTFWNKWVDEMLKLTAETTGDPDDDLSGQPDRKVRLEFRSQLIGQLLRWTSAAAGKRVQMVKRRNLLGETLRIYHGLRILPKKEWRLTPDEQLRRLMMSRGAFKKPSQDE